MTTEELKVRVSLDTSGLKQDINRAKQSLKDLNKESKVDMGGKEANEEMTNLKDTLETIRNIEFADVVIENIDKIVDVSRIATSGIKESFGHLQNAISTLWDSEAKGGRGKAAMINLREGIDSIKVAADETKLATKGFLNSIPKGAVMALAALGAVLAAVMAIKTAISTALQNAQIAFAANRVGLTTQAYQQWAYVMQQTGGEIDSLTDFIKTLTDVQNQLREGSEEMTSIFQRLGLNIEEVKNMDQSTMFATTILALQNVTNEVERTALAYKIFGEDDAAKVATILRMSNEETQALINNYHLLGATMSNELIERSQRLQGAVTNLSTAWQGLKNTLTHALAPALTWIVNALTKTLAVVNMFLKAILGIDLMPAASSINNVASGYGSYAGSADKAASATDGITKAIQKLKRVTMGFDELNKLPGTDDGSGSGSSDIASSIPDYSAIGAGGGGLEMPSIEDLGLGKIQAFVEKYKTVIQDFATVGLMAVGAGMLIAGALGGFNIPMMLKGAALLGTGIAIGSVEGGTFDRWGEKIKVWWGSFKAWFSQNIAPMLTKEYWAGQWENIKQAAAEKLNAIKTTISTGWGNVKKWFSDTIAPVFTAAYWNNKWQAVIETEKQKLEIIKAVIITLWNAVKEWFKQNVQPVFTKKYWEDKFNSIREAASSKLETVRLVITTVWENIKKWFTTNIAPKFTKAYWSGKFDAIRAGAQDKLDAALSTIKTKWDSIKKWFSTNIAPKFTTSYWSSKFSSIPSGIKSAFNTAITVVESAVNGIIKKINTLSWKIPDWVPKYGGNRFGFNFSTISIPRLATGGIAVNDTLAHIGEGGYKEAVLPLERNTEWMDTLADKINARGGSQAPANIILTIDGKELGRATINNINSITKQTGSLPLVLV